LRPRVEGGVGIFAEEFAGVIPEIKNSSSKWKHPLPPWQGSRSCEGFGRSREDEMKTRNNVQLTGRLPRG
jgi:hypothetical protein